jgi:N-acetylmuramoyl-L-alanine amidase
MVIRLAIAVALVSSALAGRAAALGSRPRTEWTLRAVQRRYGFPRPRIESERVTFQSRYSRMVFREGSRKLLLNDVLVMLNGPLRKSGRRYRLSAADVDCVLEPILRSRHAVGSRTFRTVVLDPGHGGRDTGALGASGTREKDITLDIARLAAVRIEAAGFRVRLTRTGDQTLSLGARTSMAAECGADLFVSIHVNASSRKAASGLETFVLPAPGFPSTANTPLPTGAVTGNRNDALSALLAWRVHRALLKDTRLADRGIRRGRYKVLQDAPCPAVLTECGFISNRAEERRMRERVYRRVAGQAIADAILTFAKQ